ncbi:DUF4430 domain-containing protein [Gracilibacillus marinus]|uniref:DUF4430 domain-containing protein n=1 Tax=Gracilibacillus marinus TaxID=630535 RepID=A0ABV8VVG3_9BACI
MKLKKILLLISCLLVVSLMACSPSESKEENYHATIILSLDNNSEVIEELDVSFEPPMKLLTLLENNTEIIEEDGLITSINGHEQNIEENKFWLYEINGEMAMVGTNEYEVKDNDVIHFDLGEMQE